MKKKIGRKGREGRIARICLEEIQKALKEITLSKWEGESEILWGEFGNKRNGKERNRVEVITKELVRDEKGR